MKMKRFACVYCSRRKVAKVGQLCEPCLKQDLIRELYPPLPRHEADFYGYPPLAEPTDAEPATEAKILVMQDRASRNLAIFHPKDAQRVAS